MGTSRPGGITSLVVEDQSIGVLGKARRVDTEVPPTKAVIEVRREVGIKVRKVAVIGTKNRRAQDIRNPVDTNLTEGNTDHRRSTEGGDTHRRKVSHLLSMTRNHQVKDQMETLK